MDIETEAMLDIKMKMVGDIDGEKKKRNPGKKESGRQQNRTRGSHPSVRQLHGWYVRQA